jgi:hypothetical protein
MPAVRRFGVRAADTGTGRIQFRRVSIDIADERCRMAAGRRPDDVVILGVDSSGFTIIALSRYLQRIHIYGQRIEKRRR